MPNLLSFGDALFLAVPLRAGRHVGDGARVFPSTKTDLSPSSFGTLGIAIVFSIAALVIIIATRGELSYQRYQRAREIEKERAQKKAVEVHDMLLSMSEVERQHYRELQSVAAEIRKNYQTMTTTSQVLLAQLSEKLEVLLASYLRLRHSLARYAAYFRTTSEDRIRERMAMLEREMASGPERVQQVKARTHAVLAKRLDRFAKAVENRDLIVAS